MDRIPLKSFHRVCISSTQQVVIVKGDVVELGVKFIYDLREEKKKKKLVGGR